MATHIPSKKYIIGYEIGSKKSDPHSIPKNNIPNMHAANTNIARVMLIAKQKYAKNKIKNIVKIKNIFNTARNISLW